MVCHELPLNKDLKFNVSCVCSQEQVCTGGQPSWWHVLMQTEPHVNARGRGCRLLFVQQHESVGLCVCVLLCVYHTRDGQCVKSYL